MTDDEVPTFGQAFVRDPLPNELYHTADGSPVRYGDRWGADGPPQDAYGVSSHPERFTGVQAVAEALIEYLVRMYDVEIEPGSSAELLPGVTVLRATKLVPNRREAAGITFGYTTFPGVVVHFGALHDLAFPICGCDACDTTAEDEAERLERQVFAVVAGGFQERYPVGLERWIEYSLTAADASWSESGRLPATTLDHARLEEARSSLRLVRDGWAPWPRRPLQK